MIVNPDVPAWDPVNNPASQNGPCDRAPDPYPVDSHGIESTGVDKYRCVQCRRTWTGQEPNFIIAWRD